MTDNPATVLDEAAVPPVGFLRSPAWYRCAARALVLAVVSAVAALLFVGFTDELTELLWPSKPSGEAFSGSIRVLLMLTGTGLAVGVLHKLLARAGEVDVFEAMVKGKLDARPVPGGLALAACSIVGGASLGPEVPTGMLGAGLATYAADRGEWPETDRSVGLRAAVSSAWGGLFTSPYVATLMSLELAHVQSPATWPFVVIEAAAAVVGFLIFYLAGGWAEVLSVLDLPAYQFAATDLAWAVLVGAVAAVGSVVFLLCMRGAAIAAARVGPDPLRRGLIAGVVLGLLGMALPLTLFNGAGGLVTITKEQATIGTGVIILSAVAKLAATSGALAFGFVGGPIFPAMFAGGAIGVALVDLFPSIPPGLAVAGGLAAVPAAVVSIPLSTAILGILIVGAGPASVAPVVTSALVSLVLVRGSGALLLAAHKPQQREITPRSGT